MYVHPSANLQLQSRALVDGRLVTEAKCHWVGWAAPWQEAVGCRNLAYAFVELDFEIFAI